MTGVQTCALPISKVMEPDEIIEWRWFDLDNLPEKVYFPSKKILENYKQGKFYIKSQK